MSSIALRPKPSLGRRIADRMVSPDIRSRVQRLKTAELGEAGVDPFGYDPEVVKYAAVPIEWLYRHYFRVLVDGMEKVPDGRVLLISNHSGQLPFDAMMVGASLILDRDPPRAARSMVEKWVPRLPYVSVFFARVGQVVGTPDNCRRLLAREEAILVFPEGSRGISKTIDRRYKLERFGTGFMRLALETGTPIVPVGVVGAEEQAMSVANIRPLARILGMPAFPVTPTFPLLGPAGLLPLPTRYRIYFGDPLRFEGCGDEDDEFIEKHVMRVREAIEGLLARGLRERPGLFT
jgi:1-acyl-sn-glycerol-3-phosphate acyltransferase